ncbi:MAG: hypothetical protein CO162_02575 [bacterium (Candidatus Ratteibacteria) CG_4_9_14_3_um_filter_41_21]|uniref:AbiEi antitoxin C-terminal domain-containing protein n=2 Tax=Candidatus Ratteibacteria TaxID=2979319 RepID=A0A2M7E777_9BACT|nr:MAG: hypothetical protein COS11_06600 [bacterium (Candidatus Ratteibacteria) CG01_land_8_20_14_3_00_40_19]PJA62156.1 MAG: hypothetical protein CO162_02575 [bacterium (Candidatus Ratteibacteria) CG_4_9_14_3_um_filter_41_21]
MRNKYIDPFSVKIISLVKELPYFKIENLKMLDIRENYLRIALSRLSKRKEIIRLKKGNYTAKNFVEKIKKENSFSSFLEFLATKIYSPSYLSLDYVLYENNILTEIPKNFTLITKNKTATFSNNLGIFIYHKIKDELFLGFDTQKIDNFLIYKSSPAKALFDFLYLRKKIVLNKEMLKELRLNLENFKEKAEFKKYVDLEGSRKMKEIFSLLFE